MPSADALLFQQNRSPTQTTSAADGSGYLLHLFNNTDQGKLCSVKLGWNKGRVLQRSWVITTSRWHSGLLETIPPCLTRPPPTHIPLLLFLSFFAFFIFNHVLKEWGTDKMASFFCIPVEHRHTHTVLSYHTKFIVTTSDKPNPCSTEAWWVKPTWTS